MRPAGKIRAASKKMTWRERFRALKYIPPFFKLVRATHRGFTVLMNLLHAVRAFVPVATLWVGKLIIDAVLAARASPDAANQPFYNNFNLWKLVAPESPPGGCKVPETIKHGFVFENVGFRYPESEKRAIRNVNFNLEPGERLALVGENGAGKTTLTKLIARLYDPTEGRILLDGVDLRQYDLESLRAAISVIFQDFVRYDMAFGANIGVGEVDAVESYLSQAQEIETDKESFSNGNSATKEKNNGFSNVPKIAYQTYLTAKYKEIKTRCKRNFGTIEITFFYFRRKSFLFSEAA